MKQIRTKSQEHLRRQRRLLRRRFRRRKRFLEHVFGESAPHHASATDSRDLLIGSPAAARRAAYLMKRRQLIENLQDRHRREEDQNGVAATTLSRPRRILSRLNRSSVFPALVPATVNFEFCSATELLANLACTSQKSAAHLLLDALATGSGLSVDCCAELLLFRKLTDKPIPAEDIGATISAREFWKQYGEGVAHYRALMESQAVPRLTGEWAYFDRFEFESLLPGIVIPTRLERYDYLTNYVNEQAGSSLDVYSGASFQPLFQHPFPVRFHPLFFGKPPHERTDLGSLF